VHNISVYITQNVVFPSHTVLLVEITARTTQRLCGQNVQSSLMLNHVLCVITLCFQVLKMEECGGSECFNGTWSQHLTGILSNDVGLWTG
jgi:hypothetical protein